VKTRLSFVSVIVAAWLPACASPPAAAPDATAPPVDSVAVATDIAAAADAGQQAGDATATTDVIAGDTATSPYAAKPTVALPAVAPRLAIPPTAKAGKWQDGVWVLPSGRLLTPAGDQVFLGAYPWGLAVHPNGKTAYVCSSGKSHAVQVIDLATRKIIQTVAKPALYRWLKVSPDGQFLYASGGPQANAYRFAILPDGALQSDKTYTTPYGFFGIALAPDGGHLYGLVASGKLDGGVKRPQLWRLDVETGKADAAADLAEAPYDLAISPDGMTAWLVTWKGGKVQRVRLDSMDKPGPADTIALGWNGQGIAVSPDGQTVYASSVEGDFVAVIDAASAAVQAKISLNLGDVPGMAPQGRDPGLMQLSPDGKRLYVVCAMSSEVIVIDTVARKVVGTLPTGWYPSGVALSPDGQHVLVVNAKGTGFPQPWPDASLYDGYLGTLSVIPLPSDAELAKNQTIVLDNLLGVQGVGRVPATAAQQALLPDSGGSKQIRHVIYLLRENKTFDVELGDLAGEISGVTAEPSLALFGEEYTPNLHKLAKEFCLLDNFYTDGDYSASGHSFVTAGKASDYVEKFYRLSDKGAEIAWGVGEASRPGRGFHFHNVVAHGLTARSYGEIVGMTDAWSMANILHPDFPGLIYNMSIHDVDKAKWFAKHIQSEPLPNFAVLLIPNNHTCCGSDPESPSPKSQVADNDEATGLIIEALSKHEDWASTVVFILEDDPQDGGDSVEYHRSPLVVVSPWVQRGQLVHDHHATAALHATMERALGVTPLTELDALASPIYGCFADKPNLTPFQHVGRLYPETLNKQEGKKKGWKQLERQWRGIGAHSLDEAPGLGRLLWQQYRGHEAPWPRVQFGPGSKAVDDDD
jgi:YVTN family beta-propeller protein